MIFLTYVMCAFLLISASFVIISKNPLHSVLFLVASFLSASMLLFLFENEFLALFFLIIYLDAIAILFLFVVDGTVPCIRSDTFRIVSVEKIKF